MQWPAASRSQVMPFCHDRQLALHPGANRTSPYIDFGQIFCHSIKKNNQHTTLVCSDLVMYSYLFSMNRTASPYSTKHPSTRKSRLSLTSNSIYEESEHLLIFQHANQWLPENHVTWVKADIMVPTIHQVLVTHFLWDSEKTEGKTYTIPVTDRHFHVWKDKISNEAEEIQLRLMLEHISMVDDHYAFCLCFRKK